MKCILCEKEIDHYAPEFNRLLIDEERSVDICRECIVKFLKWQSRKYAALFPTKAMKKLYGKKDQK